MSSTAWTPGEMGPNGAWESRSRETGLPFIVCNRTGAEPKIDLGPKVSDADYKWWQDAFTKLLASKEFLALRDQRDLYPFAMTGAELDAYIKKTVGEYRKLANEFGLAQKP